MTVLELPAAAAPLSPGVAALLIATRAVRGEAAVARITTAAMVVALAAALATCLADPLRGFIASAVAAIAAIVGGYAARSLSGGSIPFARFFGLIATATAGALTVAVATDLRVLVAGWIVAGLATSGLLDLPRQRPAARRWARRHVLIERIGDVALVVALVVAGRAYGTFDLAALGTAVHAGGPVPAAVLALALVAAGAARSALVPLHGWLPNSMEAPTAVSAFMHAGIVNGAGVLLAKTAPVIVAVPAALAAAALLGGITAATGAAIALVRPESKRRLGWSTVAQMGFMVLQCGCGAFAAAVVHLAAHGGYKSAAFLGVGGSIAGHARARLRPDAPPTLHPLEHAAGSLLAPAAGVLAVGLIAGPRLIALPAAAAVVALVWAAGASATRGAIGHIAGRGERIGLAAAIAAGVATYLGAVIALDGWIGARLPQLTFVPAATLVALIASAAGVLAGCGVRVAGGDRLYALALSEGRGPAVVPGP